MEQLEQHWIQYLENGFSKCEAAIRSVGRQLITRHPWCKAPILWLWATYISVYGWYQAWYSKNTWQTNAAVYPFSIQYVSPDEIEYLVEADGYPNQTRESNVFATPKFIHAGTVITGDWDAKQRQFEETDLYRAFVAHFEHGIPWNQTTFYQQSIRQMNQGVELWGCSSEAAFQRRCEYIDSLYESIARQGYRSQTELAETATDPVGDSRYHGVLACMNEITVCIGRDGEFLFLDGRNRLSIAKLLNIESIPVWVLVRHAEWNRLRDRLASDQISWNALPAQLQQHPDLRDLREPKS